MPFMRTAGCAIAMTALAVGLVGCGGESTAPLPQGNEEPPGVVGADVAVTATGPATVVAHARLTYTVVVTNLGPNAAAGVVVTDKLPTDAPFESASDGGSESNGVVTWAVGTLENGESATFTVHVKAPLIGMLVNVAASTATTPDPKSVNNNGNGLGTVTTMIDIPITGMAVSGMAGADRLVTDVMNTQGVPGAAVGIVKDGRLVFARGYGYADLDAEELMQPDARFRIGGLSNPITAAAVLTLVENGVLNLSDRAFQVLDHLEPPSGASVDPRLDNITLRQLLYHSGGWRNNRPFDATFMGLAAEAVGVAAPASAETVVRYTMGQPLDFDPGARFAHSDVGYSVLGRVIERVTGQTYEAFVRTAVLQPMGIQRMQIGATRENDRADGEVRYYHPDVTESVFPGEGQVPRPYGGFHLEAMDATGGWIASTVDLLRFVTAVDGLPERPDVLTAATVDLMVARPNLEPHTRFTWYSMGWWVEMDPWDHSRRNWWHFGQLAGSGAVMARLDWGEDYFDNHWAYVVLLNTTMSGFESVVDDMIWAIEDSVTEWPAHNLFDEFP